MATAIKPTTIRINENLKLKANEILETVGLSYNNYVVMATYQLVNQQKIPFDIVPAHHALNEETRRAFIAAQAKELGLIPDDARTFDTVDELTSFLDED